MFDTGGQYHPVYDMCGYCEMNTGGQHEAHCPLFKQQMKEGYQEMAEINIEIAKEFLPIALENYPMWR